MAASVRARRIRALRRSSERRRREDGTLREQLQAQRQELDTIQQEHTHKMQAIEAENRNLEDCLASMDALTDGRAPFTLAQLNGYRAYREVIDARVVLLHTERAGIETRIGGQQALIHSTQQAIAVNQSRIDLCEERVKKLVREAEDAQAQAEESEMEELALARRHQRSRPA